MVNARTDWLSWWQFYDWQWRKEANRRKKQQLWSHKYSWIPNKNITIFVLCTPFRPFSFIAFSEPQISSNKSVFPHLNNVAEFMVDFFPLIATNRMHAMAKKACKKWREEKKRPKMWKTCKWNLYGNYSQNFIRFELMNLYQCPRLP